MTTKILSGTQWINHFPTSVQTSDLVSPFRGNVERFIGALRSAGATVTITATYRPRERAYLMHYCCRIASGGLNPANVPAMAGVNIEWVHRNSEGQPDLTRSRNAARAMKTAYGIVYPPVLNTRHAEMRAIDMSISSYLNKTINNAQGQGVLVTSASMLHQIGATYNVIKCVGDPPHWSDDGR